MVSLLTAGTEIIPYGGLAGASLLGSSRGNVSDVHMILCGSTGHAELCYGKVDVSSYRSLGSHTPATPSCITEEKEKDIDLSLGIL